MAHSRSPRPGDDSFDDKSFEDVVNRLADDPHDDRAMTAFLRHLRSDRIKHIARPHLRRGRHDIDNFVSETRWHLWETLFQRGYWRCFRGMNGGKANPWALVALIVGRRAVSAYRSDRHATRCADQPAEELLADRAIETVADEETVVDEEFERDYRNALAALGGKQAEAWVLMIEKGLSGSEVAASMRVSTTNVYTLVHRARESLRKKLSRFWRGGR